MTLAVAHAEVILGSRLGEPAKPPTDYVVGFKTPSGKVLAIHREATETRIWFQPPAPPNLDGVHLMDAASNGNSNINGPLLPLRAPTTLRVEVDSRGALNRFLDWYTGSGSAPRTILCGNWIQMPLGQSSSASTESSSRRKKSNDLNGRKLCAKLAWSTGSENMGWERMKRAPFGRGAVNGYACESPHFLRFPSTANCREHGWRKWDGSGGGTRTPDTRIMIPLL